jgi:hypothetical protein
MRRCWASSAAVDRQSAKSNRKPASSRRAGITRSFKTESRMLRMPLQERSRRRWAGFFTWRTSASYCSGCWTGVRASARRRHLSLYSRKPFLHFLRHCGFPPYARSFVQRTPCFRTRFSAVLGTAWVIYRHAHCQCPNRPAYFFSGCQFKSSVIGEAAASSVAVFIKNRPSGDTSYWNPLFVFVPPPQRRV